MQLCVTQPASAARGARVDNTGVSSSSFALITGVSGRGSALVSPPLACFSFYWTLFCQQSRKEERRGTLIAHLNGGCHIINAYRPAIQPVTETPSHSSREERGGNGILTLMNRGMGICDLKLNGLL